MSKDWDPNLTPEQNYVLKQEGTESPGSSPLNQEKREGSYHCVGCGTKLFESTTKYESVQAGLLFSNLFQGYSKKKKICTLVTQELNIIAKNVEVITVMFSMMVQNLLENDIATMASV